MDIEEAIYSHLTSDTSVYLLVGTRVYPLSIPQDIALPAVAYQRVSGPRDVAHDGALGYAHGRFQITCQAETYEGAKDLKTAIRRCMEGFRGMMGGGRGVRVYGITVESEMDGYGMIGSIYTVRIDVEVRYIES
jgi:hypothetical protein